MAHFKKRTANTNQEIPTASMPDIIFILLIFFMVTTVLRSLDLKVKVRFTEAKNVEKITQKRLVSYIYVGPKTMPGGKEGEVAIQIDDALIENIAAVQNIMYQKYQDQPKLIVSMRVDREVKSGIILDIQKELQEAGTLRINYSTQKKREES